MTLSPVQLNALRGGRIQWTLTIDDVDYSSYLVSVEGVTKQVAFDGVPLSAAVSIKIAGLQPQIAAGAVVVVGLNTTDTATGATALWRGTIDEVTELDHYYELTCKGTLANPDKNVNYPTFLMPTAFTPREQYRVGLGCFNAPIGQVPALRTGDPRQYTRMAFSSSTLGGLSGVLAISEPITLEARDQNNRVVWSTVTANKPLCFNLQGWKTYYGDPADRLCRSKDPLAWHKVGLTLQFHMAARCDSARAKRCWWPLGYDQYFDAWLSVHDAGGVQLASLNSKADYSTGSRVNHGWVHGEGNEEEVRDKRQEPASKRYTIGAVFAGIFGLWGTAATLGAKAQEDGMTKREYWGTYTTTFGTCSYSPWTDQARRRWGMADFYPDKWQEDARELTTFTETVDFADNNSVMPDDEGQLHYVYEAREEVTVGDNTFTRIKTAYQFHGSITYEHPDLRTEILAQGDDDLANLNREYRFSQPAILTTIATDAVGKYASLPELSMLGGVGAFESANGITIVDVAPRQATLYEVPLLPSNTVSFTYVDDHPLPETVAVTFRDAFGIDYTYDVPTGAEAGAAENKVNLSFIQGNFYRGRVLTGGSGSAQRDYIDIRSTSWNGSPGLLADRLTGVTTSALGAMSYTPAAANLIDSQGSELSATLFAGHPSGGSRNFHVSDIYEVRALSAAKLFIDEGWVAVSYGQGSALDTTAPVLDVTPVKLWARVNDAVYQDNLTRKTYTCETSLAFAFCEPGTVIMASLPDYKQREPYLMLVMSVTVRQDGCTLILCPMSAAYRHLDGHPDDTWGNFTTLYNTIQSYNRR